MRYLLIFSFILVVAGCKNSDPVSSDGGASIVVGENIIHTHHSANDGYVINSVAQKGENLVFDVSYGGGCQQHNFRLMIDDGILKTMPPGIRVFLFHKNNDDICEAWLTEEVSFDLADIKNKVSDLNGRDEFSIHVVSPDSEDSTEVIVQVNLLID